MSRAPFPALDQLAADPARVRDLPPEVARDLLPRVIGLQAALLAQALSPSGSGDCQPDAAQCQPLVTGMDEAAKILGMSKSTLEKKWRRLGLGAYRDSADGRVKFPLDQLQAYPRRRQGR